MTGSELYAKWKALKDLVDAQNEFAALYPRSAELQQLRNKHLPTQMEYFSKVELDPAVYDEIQFKPDAQAPHVCTEECSKDQIDRAKTVVADLSKEDQQALYEFMRASLGCRIYER